MIDKDKNTRICVTLTKEVMEKLDKICKKEHRSKSNLISYIVAKYLEDK